jgi:hypothetical protein
MKTKVSVRYVSGRQEQFEVELFGGASTEARLKDFIKSPMITLQSENELIIIPSTAIECITLPMPDAVKGAMASSTIRKGKRVS